MLRCYAAVTLSRIMPPRKGNQGEINAVVTPLREAASYDPRIAILGI